MQAAADRHGISIGSRSASPAKRTRSAMQRSAADRTQIHALFEACGGPIREVLAERRTNVLGYLGQQGFLDPGPRLVVDVG